MSRGGIYSYAYDNIGNRTTSREGTDSLHATYVANRLNQYTDITEGTEPPFVPTYDADGNQTKIQTSTGEWETVYLPGLPANRGTGCCGRFGIR